MFRLTIESTDKIRKIARDFLEQYGEHRIFAFYGELGSGKTTFIKALCRELGVNDIVSSPSFSIINEYYSHKHGKVYHFDFFRMEKQEEVFDIGYEDYFFSGQYCFIEWADKIQTLLPGESVHIHIIVDEQSRRILQIME
jgi:tRNA threonylcarbamoyladenosine biosynthesis protein TsaE